MIDALPGAGRTTVTPASPALEVDSLSVDIRTPAGTVRAVDSIGFSVEAGRTLALLGESGCGKSMTARAITGMLDPVAHVSAGRVLMGERDVLQLLPKQRRRIAGAELAIVFQDSLAAMNPVQAVGRQIAEPFRIHLGLSRKESLERAVALMERVGIPEPRARAASYPHQFSGGMRQRLLIAVAVALQPSVLIADEPTTALDVTVQAQIMELLDELRDEHRMALVLITHDLGIVAENADEVAVMYAGRIVETGPTSAVLGRPLHPYTRALLESVPERAVRGEALRAIRGGPPPLHAIPSGCVFRDRCPMARERCAIDRPALVPVTTGRASACHFAGELLDA